MGRRPDVAGQQAGGGAPRQDARDLAALGSHRPGRAGARPRQERTGRSGGDCRRGSYIVSMVAKRAMARVWILGLSIAVASAIACTSLGRQAPGSPEVPIKMAIVPFLETQRLVKGMQALSDELGKETGLKYTGDVPTSYAAVVEAMCAERVDIGWVSPLAYVLANKQCGADMSLVSVSRQGTSYRGMVIARADAGIARIEDLQGKRFAWVDPTSTSGYLFPRALIQERGLVPDRAFSQQIYAGGHDKVALAVLQRQVDGGAMAKDVLPRVTSIYPTALEEIRVVEETPDIPNDGVAFRKGLPPEVVQKTSEALLRISAREDGQQLFEEAIGTRGVAPTTDAAYEPVRRAASVLNLDLQAELSKPK
jgi:phosphonate transport system substrate-binding protein